MSFTAFMFVFICAAAFCAAAADSLKPETDFLEFSGISIPKTLANLPLIESAAAPACSPTFLNSADPKFLEKSTSRISAGLAFSISETKPLTLPPAIPNAADTESAFFAILGKTPPPTAARVPKPPATPVKVLPRLARLTSPESIAAVSLSMPEHTAFTIRSKGVKVLCPFSPTSLILSEASKNFAVILSIRGVMLPKIFVRLLNTGDAPNCCPKRPRAARTLAKAPLNVSPDA